MGPPSLKLVCLDRCLEALSPRVQPSLPQAEGQSTETGSWPCPASLTCGMKHLGFRIKNCSVCAADWLGDLDHPELEAVLLSVLWVVVRNH